MKSLFVKKFLLAVLLIALLMPLQGCSKATKEREAKDFADVFFATIMSEDFLGVTDLCSEDFLEKSSEDEYIKMLKTCSAKLGVLRSYEFQKCTVRSTAASGTYYIMDYKTEYTRYPAVEQLTLYKRKGENEIKILGHHVSSTGFFEEE